jgi:hypothetical protein
MSEIESRRQRAREAFSDEISHAPHWVADLEDEMGAARDTAIETATRVQITPEAINAAYGSTVAVLSLGQRLARALTALGFEVVG